MTNEKRKTPIVVMPDEICFEIRYSEMGQYLEINEKNNRAVHPLTAISVMLSLANQFLAIEFSQRQGIVGGNSGDTEEAGKAGD